jgi:NADPH:quinone reductase
VRTVLAAVCPELGPPEVVRVQQVPAPGIAPGQVRVRVRAASVNYPDVLLVGGRYQLAVPPPFVPGSELAGEVVELGEGAAGLRVGMRVAGSTLVGAFAEEAVVAAASLTPVPDSVGDEVAAAFGVAHRTAYHVLRSVARLERGEELVVLGAGGGVGLAAVELGTVLGASVTAVASSGEKLAVAEAKGAARLVVSTAEDLRGALRGVLPAGADVVVDPVGGRCSEPALRTLRYGGRFVTVGYASGEIPAVPLNLVLLKGVLLTGFQFIDFATHRPDDRARDEEELQSMLASGAVRPHIGATYTLRETAAALRLVADGRAVGKVVLVIDGDR